MKTNSLTVLVEKGLISPTFDLTIDYADIALHEFCDNELLKELPIIKSVVGAVRIGNNVKEIFFIKKLLSFLKELHSGILDSSAMEDFKTRYDTDNKYKNQVIEQVMVMNDRFISVEKSKIYAQILKAHFYGKLCWDNFIAVTAILDIVNLKAIPYLKKLCEAPGYKMRGAPVFDSQLLLTASGLAGYFHYDYIASHLGLLFYHYGIIKDFSKSEIELKESAPIFAQYPELMGRDL
jgi:hypothetical protein